MLEGADGRTFSIPANHSRCVMRYLAAQPVLAAASKSSAYGRTQHRGDADGDSEKISVVVDEEDAVRNKEAARWKIALPARSLRRYRTVLFEGVDSWDKLLLSVEMDSLPKQASRHTTFRQPDTGSTHSDGHRKPPLSVRMVNNSIWSPYTLLEVVVEVRTTEVTSAGVVRLRPTPRAFGVIDKAGICSTLKHPNNLDDLRHESIRYCSKENLLRNSRLGKPSQFSMSHIHVQAPRQVKL
ncbi:hypothetical protein D6D04_08108 [Aureobasidium pullulans]|nr:hypothetical protein D6D04_08108 [Aureobasidium pullulans]